MRSKATIAAIASAVLMFAALGYLAWQAKYARGKTIGAVAVIDTVVLHQRAAGIGIRGPVGQDRLVAVDGRTGDEYARTTVLRGELVGVRGDKAVYSIGARLVLYDARTLASSPLPDGETFPPLTKYGSMTDLGDAVLLLDAEPDTNAARASRLRKESRTYEWTTELPWIGHDTKLVAQIGANVVVVDADAVAGIDRTRGGLSWAWVR